MAVARSCASLPAMSPTTASIWASAMRRVPVMSPANLPSVGAEATLDERAEVRVGGVGDPDPAGRRRWRRAVGRRVPDQGTSTTSARPRPAPSRRAADGLLRARERAAAGVGGIGHDDVARSGAVAARPRPRRRRRGVADSWTPWRRVAVGRGPALDHLRRARRASTPCWSPRRRRRRPAATVTARKIRADLEAAPKASTGSGAARSATFTDTGRMQTFNTRYKFC